MRKAFLLLVCCIQLLLVLSETECESTEEGASATISNIPFNSKVTVTFSETGFITIAKANNEVLRYRYIGRTRPCWALTAHKKEELLYCDHIEKMIDDALYDPGVISIRIRADEKKPIMIKGTVMPKVTLTERDVEVIFKIKRVVGPPETHKLYIPDEKVTIGTNAYIFQVDSGKITWQHEGADTKPITTAELQRKINWNLGQPITIEIGTYILQKQPEHRTRFYHVDQPPPHIRIRERQISKTEEARSISVEPLGSAEEGFMFSFNAIDGEPHDVIFAYPTEKSIKIGRNIYLLKKIDYSGITEMKFETESSGSAARETTLILSFAADEMVQEIINHLGFHLGHRMEIKIGKIILQREGSRVSSSPKSKVKTASSEKAYEYATLSDYMEQVQRAETTDSEGLYPTETAFPHELLEPLKQMKERSMKFKLIAEYKRKKLKEIEIPVQFEVSRYLTWEDQRRKYGANTLQIYFLPSADLSDYLEISMKFNYVSLDLFNFQKPRLANKNYIGVHRGLVEALYGETFNEQFIAAIELVAADLKMKQHQLKMKRKKGIDPSELDFQRLLLTGHSLGGSIAQLCYFLLYGESNKVPDAIIALRKLLKIPQNNEYDEHRNVILIPILPQAIDVFVLTTGAFLILPHENNHINDNSIFKTDHIINLIQPEDPVPMIFGGTAPIKKEKRYEEFFIYYKDMHEIPEKTTSIKAKIAKVATTGIHHLMTGVITGTSTAVGNYFVFFKDPKGKIHLLRLIDFPGDGPKYFTQHLLNGYHSL
eukprot:39482_1